MPKIVVAGVVVFLAVMFALPGLKGDSYSASHDSISEGALGRYGALQTVAFVILGLSSLALVRLVADNTTSRLGTIGAVLLAVWSVGVLLCAVFEIDAGAAGETTAAKVHLAAAFVAFLAGLAAVWLTTFALRDQSPFVWSLAFAIVCTLAFVVTGAAPQDSSWGGLAQRSFTVLLLLWMAAIAVALPQQHVDAAARAEVVATL